MTEPGRVPQPPDDVPRRRIAFGGVPEAAAVTLVVPVYNEAGRIAPCADALLEYLDRLPSGSELLFVDDGSTDDTVELLWKRICERPNSAASVVQREHRGKGAAVRAGLLAATNPVAGFCDVDLSTSLESLDHIRFAAERSPVLAIGSRDVVGSTISRPQSWTRELLGRVYNRSVQLAVTPGVVDTQCGAKMARTSVWHRLLEHSQEDGFAWDVEVVAFARELGISVQEIPVEWQHHDGTTVNVARDGTRMVAALARIARRAAAVRAERRVEVDRVVAQVAEGAQGKPGIFTEENASALAVSDLTHWWFRSKAAFVSSALRRTRPGPGWLADLGAGAGGVTAALGWPAGNRLVAEGSPELVEIAHQRHAMDVVRADVHAVPLAGGSAVVVCLLDVIEHLEDPVSALSEARRVAGEHGVVVVTVPAHQWLWSSADEALGHVRRYTRSLLDADLRAAGLTVELSSHVFSWLVPPVWIQRRLRTTDRAELGLDKTSILFDRAALILTALERFVVMRCGVTLPFGTSIVAVARAA